MQSTGKLVKTLTAGCLSHATLHNDKPASQIVVVPQNRIVSTLFYDTSQTRSMWVTLNPQFLKLQILGLDLQPMNEVAAQAGYKRTLSVKVKNIRTHMQACTQHRQALIRNLTLLSVHQGVPDASALMGCGRAGAGAP